jgi:hypothetical protein
VLECYDIATGERELSLPLPSGSKLTDVDGGVAVLQSGKAIILLRLADGRSYALPNHAQLADLEAPGLYYSYTSRKEGRVVLVPRADVERQLGS